MQNGAVTLERFADAVDHTDGVDVSQLPAGTTLLVQTLNTSYEVVVEAGREVCVRGGAHFPDATSAYVDGASAGGSTLRLGWIGVGMRAELHADGQHIITSQVRSITAIRAGVTALRGLRRCRTLVALILAICAAQAMTSAEPVRVAVTVRVYNSAGMPAAMVEGGLSEAGRLFGAALVDVQWVQCTSAPHRSFCRRSPGAGELVLRLVPDGGPCLKTTARLGSAVVRPTGGGVMATAYANCVMAWATATRVNGAVLLGRVVAHELGHLMLQRPGHTRRGLMRSLWTSFEVRRDRPLDWAFTAADAAAMRPQ